MHRTKDTSGPHTRIAVFCEREGLAISRLARKADMSTPHLFGIVAGNSSPKESTMERLRRAASELLARDVSVLEMFFGGEGYRRTRSGLDKQ